MEGKKDAVAAKKVRRGGGSERKKSKGDVWEDCGGRSNVVLGRAEGGAKRLEGERERRGREESKGEDYGGRAERGGTRRKKERRKRRDKKLRRKKEEGGREKQGEERKSWRIAFWNIARATNKDKEFWKGLEEWEVVVLLETWVKEKRWDSVRRRLPEGYRWRAQWAKRKNRKGGAMGGMIIGVREELVRKEEDGQGEEEGLMVERVKAGVREWTVVAVYVNGDMERKLGRIRRWMEGQEEGGRVIIGGDFNARTGMQGGRVEGGEEEEVGEGRKSKDGKINGDGRKLIKLVEETGWEILNGNMEGDEEGEYTYTGGRGETVIDYVLGDERTREGLERMELGERVESDHHPMVVTMREGGVGERVKKRRDRKVGGGRWAGRMKEEFEKGMGGTTIEGEGIQEVVLKATETIKEVMRKGEETGGREKGQKGEGWWDSECREKKKEVRRELRRWRGGNGSREVYKRRRGEYKELCERKKEEERERLIREVAEAKTENKVWDIVNRGRKKRRGVDERIKKEEWKEHFMGLLGGVENRVRMGGEEGGRKREEEGISKEEVREVVRKLKEGKAMGRDEIPNEAWKHRGERGLEIAWEICKRIWDGEGWPQGWREGIIVPLVKKGGGTKVQEYRGVTLMPTLYKIYATILVRRIEQEVEGKGMIPENQAGFRRGRGTVDHIYVLNYIIGKQVQMKKGKLVALFVDLRAAFGTLDRRTLWVAIEKRGVKEGLRERVREIYRETLSRVKVGGEIGEGFWTAKGLRQGCPLSPILFNLLIADVEEEIRKGRWGGVEVGGRRICSMAYADDLVLLAKNEEEMESMIRRLERYLEGKRLEVNVEKTKVVRFRMGEEGKERWIGDGKERG